VLVLFCRDDQLGSGKTQSLTVGDAVRNGMVNNETLAYFMARTQLFLEKVSSTHIGTATTTSDLQSYELQRYWVLLYCEVYASNACRNQ
jgi:glycyl-tRNA synthetase (class II)